MTNAKADNMVIWGGVVGVFLGPLIFLAMLIACMYLYVLNIVNNTKEGNNYKGAQYQYTIAMREGRGTDAIHWAERIRDYQNQRYKFDQSNRIRSTNGVFRIVMFLPIGA